MIEALKRHLEAEEGRRNRPYRCPAGFLTIGVGHNLDAKPLSDRAINVILEDDCADVMTELDRHFPWWRNLSSEARRVALASMDFQLGPQGLMGFRKMLAALERGDYAEAAAHARDSTGARQTPSRAARVAGMIERG